MKTDYRKSKEGERRFNNPKIYWITRKLQSLLWYFGVALHNFYSDECTKDFNCCESSIGRYAWLRINSHKKLKISGGGKL